MTPCLLSNKNGSMMPPNPKTLTKQLHVCMYIGICAVQYLRVDSLIPKVTIFLIDMASGQAPPSYWVLWGSNQGLAINKNLLFIVPARSPNHRLFEKN